MKIVYLVIMLMVGCCASASQVKSSPTSASGSYSNETLGFHYTPPSGMLDKTERFRAGIEEQAKALHATNKLSALLAMSSGADDTTPRWSSVTIETYPRNAVSEPDDAKAAAQMNAWVAHSKDASALKSVVLSGQSFTVSVFGLQEGPIKKGAVVFTTVRKGKLLSFAFAANSPVVLERLAESMKTVQFEERTASP